MKLLFATTNRGKLDELRKLVQGLPFEVLSVDDVEPLDVIEDGRTLEQNAIKKARAYAEKTGLAVVADDTGLSVDALGGNPGVRSARYAVVDEDAPISAEERYRANNEKLLRELNGLPPEQRGAEFRCALCLIAPGHHEPLVVLGAIRGRIASEPRGTKGFGYDPLFDLPEFGKTFAELSAEEKNHLSHRARAFHALRPHLEKLAAEQGS